MHKAKMECLFLLLIHVIYELVLLRYESEKNRLFIIISS